jgi:hypothetical protein
MSFTASALILTWVALLLLALVVAGLVRQVHALQREVPGSAARRAPQGRVGAVVPPIPGIDTARVRLLVLLDADCSACAGLLTGIEATLAPRVVREQVALLYADGTDPAAAALGAPVIADAGDVFSAVGATALPYGVALDADGRVAAATPVGGVAQLAPLIAAAGLDLPDHAHPEVAQ